MLAVIKMNSTQRYAHSLHPDARLGFIKMTLCTHLSPGDICAPRHSSFQVLVLNAKQSWGDFVFGG